MIGGFLRGLAFLAFLLLVLFGRFLLERVLGWLNKVMLGVLHGTEDASILLETG